MGADSPQRLLGRPRRAAQGLCVGPGVMLRGEPGWCAPETWWRTFLPDLPSCGWLHSFFLPQPNQLSRPMSCEQVRVGCRARGAGGLAGLIRMCGSGRVRLAEQVQWLTCVGMQLWGTRDGERDEPTSFPRVLYRGLYRRSSPALQTSKQPADTRMSKADVF